MKVLHISYSDKGGAAKSCIRLHLGLLAIGIDSKLLVFEQNDPTISNSYKLDRNCYLDVPKKSLFTRITGKLRRISAEFKIQLKEKKVLKHEDYLVDRPLGFEKFSNPHSEWDITKCNLYQEADIINLHWVAGFIDYPSFFTKNTKPVVWTLHDMNPFTGGCHYSGDCEDYQLGCPKCPQLKNTIDETYSSNIFDAKELSLNQIKDLFIVSPSKWLHSLASSSKLLSKFKHYHIEYGLNTKIFVKRNKIISREILDLPKNKKIILFVADSISNKRKGFEYLIQAFQKIPKNNNILLCSVGKFNDTDKFDNHIKLGIIHDERLMSIIYSSADIFVIPSLQDNLPNTVLESLCCGTPVIGFNSGGIKDMISNNKKNGLLVTSGDIIELSNAIIEYLNLNLDSTKISLQAREQYELKLQANRYKNLYFNSLKNT